MRNFLQKLGVWPFLLLGASLILIGLMSLDFIVNNWWPFDVARLDLVRATAQDQVEAAAILEAINTEVLLAFLTAVLLTITGLTLPLAFFLNTRFGPSLHPRFLIILRQSMWVGAWTAFCVWLQINRSLGLAVAALVAIVLVMFEALLQVRARAVTVRTPG